MRIQLCILIQDAKFSKILMNCPAHAKNLLNPELLNLLGSNGYYMTFFSIW